MSASFAQLDEIRLDIPTALVTCLVPSSFILKQVPIPVQVFFSDRVLDHSWINCRSSLGSWFVRKRLSGFLIGFLSSKFVFFHVLTSFYLSHDKQTS